MRAWRLLVPVLAASMLGLTYLLVQATTPDATLHERTPSALRSLALSTAALQRDVLRARAGLLRSYDPLVHSTKSLRAAAADLSSARMSPMGRRWGTYNGACNDQLLEALPIRVIVFPGSGVTDNLADKARRLGIPLLDFRKRGA
jgi:DAHL domain